MKWASRRWLIRQGSVKFDEQHEFQDEALREHVIRVWRLTPEASTKQGRDTTDEHFVTHINGDMGLFERFSYGCPTLYKVCGEQLRRVGVCATTLSFIYVSTNIALLSLNEQHIKRILAKYTFV